MLAWLILFFVITNASIETIRWRFRYRAIDLFEISMAFVRNQKHNLQWSGDSETRLIICRNLSKMDEELTQF